MEANGKRQRSNNKCLWPGCLVEAAARDFKHFKGFWCFRGLRLANGRLERSNNRGLWRQTAGCNALTTEGLWRQTGSCNARTTHACGQSAWWKLPRGILSILRVLSVLGGFKAGKTAGLNAHTTEGCGGKRQAATLGQQMLVARVLGGSCRGRFEAFKGFERFQAGKRPASTP